MQISHRSDLFIERSFEGRLLCTESVQVLQSGTREFCRFENEFQPFENEFQPLENEFQPDENKFYYSSEQISSL